MREKAKLGPLRTFIVEPCCIAAFAKAAVRRRRSENHKVQFTRLDMTGTSSRIVRKKKSDLLESQRTQKSSLVSEPFRVDPTIA